MKPEITKFLSGGLNLLAAGDSIQEGQCIAAQNWRSDQIGLLRGRKSNSGAVASPGGNVHSIASVKRSTGVTRYYGADDVLYRGATSIATGFDGKPLGLCSFQDRLWITNRNGNQSKDDGVNSFQWTITPPTGPTLAYGGVSSGDITGEFIYYVSYLNEWGEESSAKFGSPTGVLATDEVTITVPTPGDSQVTAWNVYRESLTAPLNGYKINAEPIPIATTTYLDKGQDLTGTGGDDQTDLGLASLGVARPTDHDAAPEARGVAGPYFQKLLAFSTTAHPNRLYWTPSDEPSYFPGSDSEQDGNWVDIGEDGEEILAVAVFPRYVVILKEKTIHRLVGDPDDWGADIQRTNAEVGQIGATAWAVAGGTVFGQADEYLYAFNGDRAEKISLQLDPIFKLDGAVTSGAIPSAAISGDRTAACMAYRNGRLYFSCSAFTLIYEKGQFFTDTRTFTALCDEGQGGALLGAYGGNVYELETGSNETDIPLIYHSRYEDQGAPENKKRYSDILIEHNTAGRTFTAYAYLDNGATVRTLGTFSSTARTQSSFTLNTDEFRNCAVRLECSAGNAVAEIYALALHYLPLERNARTYDSGKIPLENVSLLGAFQADLEILSGSVAYQFSYGITDLATNISGTFTGGLRTQTAQIPDGTEAQWVRLILTGDNFRCHGARVQTLPYGCYMVAGQIFRSGDLTMGSPRVKLLQQIRVDCDPDANAPGQFLSDTPGHIAERADFTLTSTTGRAWQRTNFPMNTRGKVCRVEISPTGVLRLYAVQVRAKVLGEPGGWQWLDVPVPPTPAGFSWITLPIK